MFRDPGLLRRDDTHVDDAGGRKGFRVLRGGIVRGSRIAQGLTVYRGVTTSGPFRNRRLQLPRPSWGIRQIDCIPTRLAMRRSPSCGRS